MRSPIHVPTELDPEARGCDPESLRDIRYQPSRHQLGSFGMRRNPHPRRTAKAKRARLYDRRAELEALV
jgi:hypothetical protein